MVHLQGMQCKVSLTWCVYSACVFSDMECLQCMGFSNMVCLQCMCYRGFLTWCVHITFVAGFLRHGVFTVHVLYGFSDMVCLQCMCCRVSLTWCVYSECVVGLL